jgi:RNA polymerase sigma factor (sigma-70 family)
MGVKLELERIYERHRQGLYTLALAITRDAGMADDAVQEAFFRLLRAKVEPRGDITGYVFAAVRNAAVDRRKMRVEVGAETTIFADDGDRPEAKAEQSETEGMLRRAVEELGQAEKEAVVMKIYGDLTFEQMAAAAGEPVATVASRYRRALEKIRASLAVRARE